MKTLYESILDNDFDVNDNAVAATIVQKILNNPHNLNRTVTVKVIEDKAVVDFEGWCACADTGELLEIMEEIGIKKIVFNGSINLTFNRNATFKGYDISAEDAKFIFSNNSKITFEHCIFRFAGNLQYSSTNFDSKNKIVLRKGTTVYAPNLDLFALDCEMDRTAQLNINHELNVIYPTKSQLQWMKKSNIPMSHDDIQNQMSPDIRTDPLSGLFKTKESIINCVVIGGSNLDFTYRFFSVRPDHTTRELISFDLASGWTLIIK